MRDPHQQAQGASHTLMYTNYDMNTGVGAGGGSQEPRELKQGGDSGGSVAHAGCTGFSKSLPRAEPKDRHDIWPLWSRNDPDVKNATVMAAGLFGMHWWRVIMVFYRHGF